LGTITSSPCNADPRPRKGLSSDSMACKVCVETGADAVLSSAGALFQLGWGTCMLWTGEPGSLVGPWAEPADAPATASGVG